MRKLVLRVGLFGALGLSSTPGVGLATASGAGPCSALNRLPAPLSPARCQDFTALLRQDLSPRQRPKRGLFTTRRCAPLKIACQSKVDVISFSAS